MKRRRGKKTVGIILTVIMAVTSLMPAWAYGNVSVPDEPVAAETDSQTTVLPSEQDGSAEPGHDGTSGENAMQDEESETQAPEKQEEEKAPEQQISQTVPEKESDGQQEEVPDRYIDVLTNAGDIYDESETAPYISAAIKKAGEKENETVAEDSLKKRDGQDSYRGSVSVTGETIDYEAGQFYEVALHNYDKNVSRDGQNLSFEYVEIGGQKITLKDLKAEKDGFIEADKAQGMAENAEIGVYTALENGESYIGVNFSVSGEKSSVKNDMEINFHFTETETDETSAAEEKTDAEKPKSDKKDTEGADSNTDSNSGNQLSEGLVNALTPNSSLAASRARLSMMTADNIEEANETEDSTAEQHGIKSIEVRTEDPRYFKSFEKDETGQFDYIFKTYSGKGGAATNKAYISVKPENPDDKVWLVRVSEIAIFQINEIDQIPANDEIEYYAGVRKLKTDVPNYIVVGTKEPTGRGNTTDLQLYEDVNTVYKVNNETVNLVADITVKGNNGDEYTLQPEFDSFTDTYDVYVPSILDSVVIGTDIYNADYYIGENEVGSGKNVKIPIGENTENPYDNEGKITIDIKAEVDEKQDYKVILHSIEKPVITKQPTSRYWCEEEDKDTQDRTLSIEAEIKGDGELSYQWYKNDEKSNSGGELIEGATGASYTVPFPEFNGSLLTKEEYYYCIVTYTDDSDTETEAVSDCSTFYFYPSFEVTITEADGDPVSEAGYEYVYEGEPLTGPEVTVVQENYTGSEEGEFKYEWITQANGYGSVIGEGKTFTIPIKDGGAYTEEYWCRVTFTADSGEKSSYFVSENSIKISKTTNLRTPEVKITSQPEGGTYDKGTVPELEVGASANGGNGEVELHYQWQRSTDGKEFTDIESYIEYDNYQSGTQYKRADQNSYTPESDSTDAYYRCRVSATSTEDDGKVYESEPVYSEAAHIEYKDIFDMEGSGTETDPYLIDDSADLEAVRDEVNDDHNSLRGVYFKMTEDITLPANWEPIGVKEYQFSGNIDGGENLLTVPEGELSLLGYTSEATLKNLDIYGEEIAGYGVVQYYTVDRTGSYDVIIDNVDLKSGTKTKMSGYIGGYASGVDEVIIRNCTVEEGVVIGYDKNQISIGSFAGDFNGYIENCVSYADVYGKSNVGGIMGRKGQSMGPCRITNCEFYGSVNATGDHVGGILASGYVADSAPNTPLASVENCAVYGSVSGSDYVGGIFGGESGSLCAWPNGIGYVRDNWFGGTIESEGQYVGAVIGYINTINRYNEIENNYYISDCGADRGIGGISRVDTNCETVDKSDTNVTYINQQDYHRTDDPLGADRDKLTKAVSAGSAAEGLNGGREDSFGNWTTGEDGQPVHDKENVRPYRIVFDDIYPSSFYQGETIDLSGIDFTVWYTDGSKKTVDGSEFTVSGYDPDDTGQQTVQIKYGGAFLEMEISVLKNDAGNITVVFSLLGDVKHGEALDVHTLADSNLTTWIKEDTYTLKGNSTVLDLLDEALDDYNEANPESRITYSNPTGNYIESFTNGTLTLAEFDNGQNSGWMYTINGVHSDLGVAEQYLESGDEIVFHYTDDYTKETPVEELIRPADIVEMIDGIGEVTLAGEDSINEIKEAYDNLSEEQKKLITNYDVLQAALEKLEELKAEQGENPGSSDDEETEGKLSEEALKAYEDTGKYLSDAASENAPKVGSTGGEWQVLGLVRSGDYSSEKWETEYYSDVLEYVNENINENEQLHSAKSTENSRLILALTALGRDVTDVDGHNLLKGLSDLDYLKKQGINGPIWALLAFDSHDYEIPEAPAGATQATRENIIETILVAAVDEGGWALSGNTADPDMTGMALQALAPYYDSNAEVKDAVDKALTRLSEMQRSDGGFASWGSVNAESCAQVIVALTSLGIDPDKDERFVKNGKSVVDAMLEFAVDGGGFAHTANGSLNGMSTEQAYYALVSYDRFLQGKTSLYDMTDVSFSASGEEGDINTDTKGDEEQNSDVKDPAINETTKVKAGGTTRSLTKTANISLDEMSSEARNAVSEISKVIAAVNAEHQDEGSGYTDEQIRQVTEAYKAYNELSEADKAAVEATDEWKQFMEITSAIGRIYHHDEATGVDMRNNDEEALPWYIKLDITPEQLSESQTEDLKAVLGDESEMFTLNDISFIDTLDESQWYPEEILEVSMPMVDIGDYRSAVIVHIADDGDIDLIEGTVENDDSVISFQAADFSLYGIAGSMESIDALLGAQTMADVMPWIIAAAAAVVVLAVLIYIRRRSTGRAA